MLIHLAKEAVPVPSTLKALVTELLGRFRQETTCDRAVCVEGNIVLAKERQNLVLCQTCHRAVASLKDRWENKGVLFAGFKDLFNFRGSVIGETEALEETILVKGVDSSECVLEWNACIWAVQDENVNLFMKISQEWLENAAEYLCSIYLTDLQLGQAFFRLSDDIVLGGRLVRVGTSKQLGANGEMRSEVEFAQENLGLLVGRCSINLTYKTLGLALL